MNNRNKRSDPDSQLYSAILKLQTVEECYDFFTDLCTFSELKAMEQRFELAKLLNDGLIYNDILEKTGASSATISRRILRCESSPPPCRIVHISDTGSRTLPARMFQIKKIKSSRRSSRRERI